MNLSPIVLFVYNRPLHTRQTLDALMANVLASHSTLFIYADGPKANAAEETLQSIAEIRKIIREKQWCKEVTIIEGDTNSGLAKSIVKGVTDVVNKYGKVIVLEDDIVTSKGFLKYMNDALTMYEDEEQVMQVSGFMHPVPSHNLPDTFFYNFNSCWGWATWKRAWKMYNSNALDLYSKLIEKKVDWQAYTGYQSNDYRGQLIANIEGNLNTWAVKWHSSMYLNDGLVLHPKKSLVRNVGFDGSGVHCGNDDNMQKQEYAESVSVTKIKELKEDEKIIQFIKEYFNKELMIYNKPRNPLLYKLFLRLANKVK